MATDLVEVLQALKVKTIYWVDDDNTKIGDMDAEKLRDEVFAGIASKGAQSIKNVISKVPVSWVPDLKKLQKTLEDDEAKEPHERPDRSNLIEAKLNDLLEKSNDEMADLRILFESLDGKLSTAEKAALTSLFKPLASEVGYTWKALSFSDWESQQATILSTHTATEQALVLLDQQNTRDKSSLDGAAILANVCGIEAHREAFKFLVVTNTCAPDAELQHAAELAKDVMPEKAGIRSPVFALSKQRIARSLRKGEEGQSLESQFVSLLRRLRLSLLNQQLTALARGVIQEATDRAFERLTKITLHEFMYAVTQSSQIEGVSELDTLLRLIAIEQRDAMLEKVIHSKELRAAIESIRGTPVDIRKKEISDQDDLARLRGREIYWPAQAVNKLHQPIAAGDLFEVRTGNRPQYFVLLGNDCDLMLRGEGDRNSTVILLAELAEDKGGNKDTDAYLECPLPQNPLLTRVPLNRFLSASTEVLDLCWLNADGACLWDKSADYEKLHLLKSQKSRLNMLRDVFTKPASLRRVVASSPIPFSRAPRSNEKVDFKLRRIGRMNTPYAQGILSKFAGVFSRPSYEHNYSHVRDMPAEPPSAAGARSEASAKSARKEAKKAPLAHGGAQRGR